MLLAWRTLQRRSGPCASWGGRSGGGRSKGCLSFGTTTAGSSLPETEDVLLSQILGDTAAAVVDRKVGFAKVSGAVNASLGSLVQFETTKLVGLVVSLETNSIGVALLSTDFGEAIRGVHMGEKIIGEPERMCFPVGKELLGRVVDALGEALDDKGDTAGGGLEKLPTLRNAVPSIVARGPISKPFYTGVKFIDILHPLGCGQRLAFRGPKGTGKTRAVLDVISNQMHHDSKCIYVAIGHTKPQLDGIVEDLEAAGVMGFTTIVAAPEEHSVGMQYLAPYSGCTLAEHFRDQGEDVLIVYDELGNHANSIASIGAMINQPVVNANAQSMHSNLLERAAQLSEKRGNGSLTAIAIVDSLPDVLPIGYTETTVDTMLRHISSGINSVVDDVIDFEDKLAKQARWPAVSILDFAKLASAACQPYSLQKMVRHLHQLLVDAREAQESTERMEEFGIDPLDEGKEDAIEKLLEKEKMEILFGETAVDSSYTPLPRLIFCLYASIHGFLSEIPIGSVVQFENLLWEQAQLADGGNLVKKLEQIVAENSSAGLHADILNEIKELIEEVVVIFKMEFDDGMNYD